MRWTKKRDRLLLEWDAAEVDPCEIAELLDVTEEEVAWRLDQLRPQLAPAPQPDPPPAAAPSQPAPLEEGRMILPFGEIAAAAKVPLPPDREPKIAQDVLYQCLAKVAIALCQETPELERAKAAIDDVVRPRVVRVGNINEGTQLSEAEELLDYRTVTALEEAGIMTFADLLASNDADLERLPNMGKKTIAAIAKVREDIRNVLRLRRNQRRLGVS